MGNVTPEYLVLLFEFTKETLVAIVAFGEMPHFERLRLATDDSPSLRPSSPRVLYPFQL